MEKTNNFLDSLKWRYATKKFDAEKKVSGENMNEILEAGRLSASSFGLQPWKFVVVENKETRQKLREAGWNQAQIADASHLVVLCARRNMEKEYIEKFVRKTAEIREIPPESLKGYEEMMIGSIKGKSQQDLENWNKKQVYIALGTMLSACALKRIDACPMEGFDNVAFDKILGLGDYTSAAIMAVGYRAEDDEYAQYKKSRFDIKDVVQRI